MKPNLNQVSEFDLHRPVPVWPNSNQLTALPSCYGPLPPCYGPLPPHSLSSCVVVLQDAYTWPLRRSTITTHTHSHTRTDGRQAGDLALRPCKSNIFSPGVCRRGLKRPSPPLAAPSGCCKAWCNLTPLREKPGDGTPLPAPLWAHRGLAAGARRCRGDDGRLPNCARGGHGLLVGCSSPPEVWQPQSRRGSAPARKLQ